MVGIHRERTGGAVESKGFFSNGKMTTGVYTNENYPVEWEQSVMLQEKGDTCWGNDLE